MTTPPKAQKFRIRRPSGNAAAAAKAARAADGDMPFAPGSRDDGFGDMSQRPDAGGGKPARPLTEEVAAVREEGLSARQLRTARRLAVKNGITAADDFEAVALLRRKGIDPFNASSPALSLVKGVPDDGGDQPRVHLPQTVAKGETLPAPQTYGEAQRAQEIIRIQQDIVRRRRRNFMMLMARLAIFVILPTIVAGYYYFAVATPMYATRSEFVIQQAEGQSGGLGSLFRGTQFATSQDSITVQSYLQSRDAMARLDADLGFKAHFSQERIDPIQRLAPDASNEAAYKLYKRNVRIGFDPSEGIIKLEVIATDPATSQAFSEALIGYAEERVDRLSLRLREDQMQGAREVYEDAEKKLLAAQMRVQELQERLGVFDPLSESGAIQSQISALDLEAQRKRLELQQLLDNARPNQARVEGVKGDIARIETMVAGLREQLTGSTASGASLAAVTGEMRIAEHDLETRQLMLSQALQQLELARIEANRQVRYLSTGVSPIAPDEPTYPRAFENTALAFLIFAGIYLMLSLTVSILREQVSA